MRIPFLDYITPRIFPKIRRVHRLKASRTIIPLKGTPAAIVETGWAAEFGWKEKNDDSRRELNVDYLVVQPVSHSLRRLR